MTGRGLFNIPCRICRRPTIHRTRTRHPERKSKSEGHCGSYRAGRERRNSQIPTSTQALLPTSTHSNGFCIIRVCISSSSSSRSLGGWRGPSVTKLRLKLLSRAYYVRPVLSSQPQVLLPPGDTHPEATLLHASGSYSHSYLGNPGVSDHNSLRPSIMSSSPPWV